MKAQELRAKTVEEIKSLIDEKQSEQFKTRMKYTTGQLTQTHLLKQLRKELARMNTVLNEKTKAGN